jgi:hypothetical protein
MAEFIAYIDEAGDEGFGKLRDAGGNGGQSRWLLIGACLVCAEDDRALPSWRDSILARLPGKRRDLHFRDLNHDQKVFVSQEISKLPVGAAVAFSHKVTIPGSRWEQTFKRKGYLYNYLVRWLLERISFECAPDLGEERNSLKLVFSRRGGTDYAVMRDYLTLLRDGRELLPPVRTIDWNVVDVNNIAVETHKKWAGLQIADCITSAFFSAVEPNVFGNYEPRYAEELRSRVITRANRGLNHGVTPVPSLGGCQPTDHHRGFFNSF